MDGVRIKPGKVFSLAGPGFNKGGNNTHMEVPAHRGSFANKQLETP